MQVRMTGEMVEALKQTAELPDNLAATLEAATQDAEQYLVNLTDDEAMAMDEMCQWYIKKDPDTGELTPKATLFNSIVNALDEAEFG